MSYSFKINLKSLQVECKIFSYKNLQIYNSKFDDNLLNCELTLDFGFSKTTIIPSLTLFDFENLLKQLNTENIYFEDVDQTVKYLLF